MDATSKAKAIDKAFYLNKQIGYSKNFENQTYVDKNHDVTSLFLIICSYLLKINSKLFLPQYDLDRNNLLKNVLTILEHSTLTEELVTLRNKVDMNK